MIRQYGTYAEKNIDYFYVKQYTAARLPRTLVVGVPFQKDKTKYLQYTVNPMHIRIKSHLAMFLPTIYLNVGNPTLGLPRSTLF